MNLLRSQQALSVSVINPQIYRQNMASLEGPVSHIKLFKKVWIQSQMLIERDAHAGVDAIAVPDVKPIVIEDFIREIRRQFTVTN